MSSMKFEVLRKSKFRRPLPLQLVEKGNPKEKQHSQIFLSFIFVTVLSPLLKFSVT